MRQTDSSRTPDSSPKQRPQTIFEAAVELEASIIFSPIADRLISAQAPAAAFSQRGLPTNSAAVLSHFSEQALHRTTLLQRDPIKGIFRKKPWGLHQ